jgi:hypothetical protein
MRLIGRTFLPPAVLLAALLLIPAGAFAQSGTHEAVVDLSARAAAGRFAPLGPDGIRDALRLASDETAARKVLGSYVIWTRAGWGDGPLIGSFSTPFSRVVRAALKARASGRTLTAADIPPSLLAPEVQVIAMSQLANGTDLERSRVQRIVFVQRGHSGDEEVIEPLKVVPFTQHGVDAVVGPLTNAAVIATFPLDALAAATEIRVQFDRAAVGSTAMSMCQTCVMRLESETIR